MQGTSSWEPIATGSTPHLRCTTLLSAVLNRIFSSHDVFFVPGAEVVDVFFHFLEVGPSKHPSIVSAPVIPPGLS